MSTKPGSPEWTASSVAEDLITEKAVRDLLVDAGYDPDGIPEQHVEPFMVALRYYARLIESEVWMKAATSVAAAPGAMTVGVVSAKEVATALYERGQAAHDKARSDSYEIQANRVARAMDSAMKIFRDEP